MTHLVSESYAGSSRASEAAPIMDPRLDALRNALRAGLLGALWGGLWGGLLGVIFVGDNDLVHMGYSDALLVSAASIATFAAVLGASVSIFDRPAANAAKAAGRERKTGGRRYPGFAVPAGS